MKPFAVIALVSILVGAGACSGSRLPGTYSNDSGSVVLDLKAGGTGALTISGDSKPCTYTSDRTTVKLTCDGDEIDFTIHDDGSLTGPPDSLVGALKKSGS